MDVHPGIVVFGEPDPATRALYKRTLSTVFTVPTAPDDATILALLRRDRGASAYLVKPTLPATLLETIQLVLHPARR